MAIDNKYGKVTLEHGYIGENEPVVVFRASDATLPALLTECYEICLYEGSPERHLNLILNTREVITEWQRENPEKVKIPNSESSREWMD